MHGYRLAFFLVLWFSPFLSGAQVAGISPLFIQDSLKQVASGFSFTEGCSVDAAGNVFFTDQPNDKIWKYGTDGKISLFMEKSGRANGSYFDRKGNLVVCADERGEIWSIRPNAKVKILLKDYEGKQFNGPNDLWINASGDIYFTDPYYQRDYWQRTSPDLQHNDVYFLPKGARQALMVASGMVRPNGIVGTPDGKYLYVADIGAGKTYRYAIGKNGVLEDKKLIVDKGSDGMTLDAKGNIYLTGGGSVLIYSPEGILQGQIKVPEGPSNVCFAGKTKDILFITARKSVYILPMNVKGVE
ncbi:SMP-30/gluconolactonase/LRE family protein [Pedobacter sp. MC2016-24]|uniref:SMP-30/gluconolactonase/LRE family protein n=1 Tax=Pedobacter sp. MC2016-24 TaxID=2780090 RepID=UPI001880FB10|nr:SMP-30/gluconolactonase/LRE family protein [Pedobacter sp. MC2016-24]MBE9599653.1 SMP-30/gluconolactonase/LRE family protein [Pedobacter sp. MC2016-24]